MTESGSASCPNCGLIARGRYCGSCGSPTTLDAADAWRAPFAAEHAHTPLVVAGARELTRLVPLLAEPFLHFATVPSQIKNRLFWLGLIGIFPIALATSSADNSVKLWAIALYFSGLWSVFFSMAYRERGVRLDLTVAVFFSAVFQFGLYRVLQESELTALLHIIDNGSLPHTLVNYYLIGVAEEFVKALPLFAFWFSGALPRLDLFIFYGLISGLGFASFESVDKLHLVLVHSIGADATDFFQQVSRLTSAPFFHATWTGILAFFMWFGIRFPRHRGAFFAFAFILVSPVLHGLYDSFSDTSLWPIVLPPYLVIGIGSLAVAILGVYVAVADGLERKLNGRPVGQAATAGGDGPDVD